MSKSTTLWAASLMMSLIIASVIGWYGINAASVNMNNVTDVMSRIHVSETLNRGLVRDINVLAKQPKPAKPQPYTPQWLADGTLIHPGPGQVAPFTPYFSAEEIGAPNRYHIQWGDTLSQIGETYGKNYHWLAQLNGYHNPDLIYAGAWMKLQ